MTYPTVSITNNVLTLALNKYIKYVNDGKRGFYKTEPKKTGIMSKLSCIYIPNPNTLGNTLIPSLFMGQTHCFHGEELVGLLSKYERNIFVDSDPNMSKKKITKVMENFTGPILSLIEELDTNRSHLTDNLNHLKVYVPKQALLDNDQSRIREYIEMAIADNRLHYARPDTLGRNELTLILEDEAFQVTLETRQDEYVCELSESILNDDTEQMCLDIALYHLALENHRNAVTLLLEGGTTIFLPMVLADKLIGGVIPVLGGVTEGDCDFMVVDGLLVFSDSFLYGVESIGEYGARLMGRHLCLLANYIVLAYNLKGALLPASKSVADDIDTSKLFFNQE